MGRKRSKRSAADVWRRRCLQAARAACACGHAGLHAALRSFARRRAPRPPRVIVIGEHPGRRRLARTIARAARAYTAALGVPLPPHTTVVLVPAVVEGGRVHGLLQVAAPPAGTTRAVIYLATGPGGTPAGGDVLAVLRLLVGRLLQPATGAPTVSVPVTLPAVEAERPAQACPRIVPLRPPGGMHLNGTVPFPPSGPGPSPRPGHGIWPDDDPA